ncbi:hypothetical protein BJX96DRAFT_161496 [Aspergillus floccosus]
MARHVSSSVRFLAVCYYLLWRLHTGYILHTCVPITDGMRIAELGPGTGLHGFDISDEQFPRREQCPSNVRFDIMDSFYDVVYLRMWASDFRNKDPGAILHPVMELLRSGGFIQWEEADLTHQTVVGEKAKEFEAGVNKLFGQVGLAYSLPHRVTQAGFLLIEFERQQFENSLMNSCTNTYLLALQEILQGIRQSSSSEEARAIMDHEIALHYLFSAERKRIVYNWSPTTLLG